jgi:cytidylate kinase
MCALPVIAIDGTAASGKGTLARKLAEILGFACLDTGKLYRYVAHSILAAQGDPDDEALAVAVALDIGRHLTPEALRAPALEGDRAGSGASKVARFPGVRAALFDYQRGFAARPPGAKAGAILDGRDIGTVICPEADVKFYVTAPVEARAERRFKELQAKGLAVIYEAVLADMRERDARDAGRDAAPMKPAADAVLLDTGGMGIEEVLAFALAEINRHWGTSYK